MGVAELLQFQAQTTSSLLQLSSQMTAIPYPFFRCEKATIENSDATIVELNPLLEPRTDLVIGKRTRWSIFFLSNKDDASTVEVFDDLWKQLGGPFRSLSVARRGDTMWALLYKGDQQVISSLSNPIETAHEIKKPMGGGATRNKIADFAEIWFTSTTMTTNFALEEAEEEEDADTVIKDLYETLSETTEKEYQFKVWAAKWKKPSGRSPRDRALVAGQAPYRAIKKEDAKHKLQDGIVFRVGEQGCTKLVYPDDVPTLAAKLGRTYNPLTKRRESVKLSEYVESRLHLEKTLVLWGAGGNQKSPSAEAIAKDFAIRYNTAYIKGSSPEALKKVQFKFDRLVTVIFEEFSADDVSQHGKMLSANYFKHLLDVRNGGQVRIKDKVKVKVQGKCQGRV